MASVTIHVMLLFDLLVVSEIWGPHGGEHSCVNFILGFDAAQTPECW